jgi:hypothetical protein
MERPRFVPIYRRIDLTPAPDKRRTRSSATTGGRLHILPVDGRTVAGRRFRDLVELLEAERGGANALDVATRAAVRGYAQLLVERELLEAKRASGHEIDAEVYGQLLDRCDRLLRRMGPPVSKTTRVDLHTYLAQRASA